LLIVLCLAALTCLCFGRAIFHGEQFSYRDAAHFYYPLYQRVQAEWDKGHWPLWEPEENAGMPLLGNPTAAVLYPGKIAFAFVSYPVGMRVYVIAHALLAFATMLTMLRSFGVSWTGAGLGGLSYAFSGPVLFQYCNIIYLVGAAWLPLGLLAVDRWLRLGRRRAIPLLAVVLAMEVLGGDPEMAYLTGLCAGGYAAALAWRRAEARRGSSSDGRAAGRRVLIPRVIVPAAVMLAIVWVSSCLVMAHLSTKLRAPKSPPPEALPWMWAVPPAVSAAWGVAALATLAWWRRQRRAGVRPAPTFVPMLAGLAGAAALAGAISAAQLLPVLEFTGQSARAAGEGPHDIFPFSLNPPRVVEMIWPNVFGTPFHGNRSWVQQIDFRNSKIWVPSLYMGGLTLVLALAGARFRGATAWRGWMTAIAALSLIGSFGEYTSPILAARFIPAATDLIGTHDPDNCPPLRVDRELRDGVGSLYWGMATFLPGFRQFRFPSKLLTLTVLSLSALAAAGWDGLAEGDVRTGRRVSAWSRVLLGLTLALLIAVTVGGGPFSGWLKAHDEGSGFGPFDAAGAVRETRFALAQGAALLSLALLLVRFAPRRPALAAAAVLAVTTADLATANARSVITAPQQMFEGVPELLRIINEDAKAHPYPGPYRIHRMPLWNPGGWGEQATTDRVRDFLEWERKTIQPKYGINYGVQYTLTYGVAELYDYEWFFGGFLRSTVPEAARALGIEPGEQVVVFPRRSFDMWNSRYFILPMYANKWTDEQRGFATMLAASEPVFPPRDYFEGPDKEARTDDFIRNQDFQIRRNLDCFPRAWVVHGARYLKPIQGLTREERRLPMEEIIFSNELFWRDPTRTIYDPKSTVWLDISHGGELARYLAPLGRAATPSETVTVTRYEPTRVELDAVLEQPGMVVLSDSYYPGWELTIDGKPAPVYRANRMMRGAAVESGRHKLVYTFNSRSFLIGRVVSCAGLVGLVLLGAAFARWPFASWSPTEPEQGPA
jgi:hypothetical protein